MGEVYRSFKKKKTPALKKLFHKKLKINISTLFYKNSLFFILQEFWCQN